MLRHGVGLFHLFYQHKPVCAAVQALDLDEMPTVDEPMSAAHTQQTDTDSADR